MNGGDPTFEHGNENANVNVNTSANVDSNTNPSTPSTVGRTSSAEAAATEAQQQQLTAQQQQLQKLIAMQKAQQQQLQVQLSAARQGPPTVPGGLLKKNKTLISLMDATAESTTASSGKVSGSNDTSGIGEVTPDGMIPSEYQVLLASASTSNERFRQEEHYEQKPNDHNNSTHRHPSDEKLYHDSGGQQTKTATPSPSLQSTTNTSTSTNADNNEINKGNDSEKSSSGDEQYPEHARSNQQDQKGTHLPNQNTKEQEEKFDFTSMSGPIQYPKRTHSLMNQAMARSVTQDGNNETMIQHAHDTEKKYNPVYSANSNNALHDTSSTGSYYYHQQQEEQLGRQQHYHQQYQQQQHQFHYGQTNSNGARNNSNHNNNANGYRDPYVPYDPFYEDPDRSQSCCLLSCLITCLTAEYLHRSFCFGAIDGMLTGSGITAACVGLEILNTETSSLATQLTVVALCLAACTSDAICMAIGHIWSVYVLQDANMQERKEERNNFENYRADAKAKLVDMLLSRGMLKIDAMSIADTLEGYPDIFVSALVGDPSGQTFGVDSRGSFGSFDEGDLTGLGGRGGSYGSFTGGHYGGALGLAGGGRHHGSYGSLGGGNGGNGGGGGMLNPDGGDYIYGHYPVSQRSSGGSRMGRMQKNKFGGSYGQFDEFEEDPDLRALNLAVQDGCYEGLFILLGFGIFSVIPSLIYISVPALFPSNYEKSTHYSSSYGFNYGSMDEDEDDTGISPLSVSLCVASLLMLMLGIWKSQFYNSNWVVFGIETVLVLHLCVFSAYGLGVGLKRWISSA